MYFSYRISQSSVVILQSSSSSLSAERRLFYNARSYFKHDISSTRAVSRNFLILQVITILKELHKITTHDTIQSNEKESTRAGHRPYTLRVSKIDGGATCSARICLSNLSSNKVRTTLHYLSILTSYATSKTTGHKFRPSLYDFI